ncbi:MAG: hypothetical protein V1896_01725 [Candidatus Zambryskibacteria bacterium]
MDNLPVGTVVKFTTGLKPGDGYLEDLAGAFEELSFRDAIYLKPSKQVWIFGDKINPELRARMIKVEITEVERDILDSRISWKCGQHTGSIHINERHGGTRGLLCWAHGLEELQKLYPDRFYQL